MLSDESSSALNIRGKTKEELIDMLNSYQNALEIEKRYHATLENMKEGFQIISFDWRYLYVNNTVVMQSKFSREQLLGRTMMELYPGIELTAMFKVLQQCMTERIPRSMENEFTYPDQSKGWFDLSIQPVDEGLLILSMDITSRKRSEQEKERHIRELREVLHKISHEVRPPVCQILGVSNLLEQAEISQEDLKKIIRAMKDSALILDNYTKELTNFVYEMELKEQSE